MSSVNNEDRFRKDISRRFFLLRADGLLGGTALLSGCSGLVFPAGKPGLSISDKAPQNSSSEPLRQFYLDVRPAEIEIAAGRRISAWTYDGKLSGTEIRVREGKAPLKDTVLIEPTMHGRIEFEFLADNPGNWLIHCHHAYHLAAGMERLIKYV